MPFIPGKLKPRIKPRLGARAPGVAENVDQLKNKLEDQNPSLELLVNKPALDVLPPSSEPLGSQSSLATSPLHENRSQVSESDVIQSGIEPSNADISKDQNPSSSGDWDKKNELATSFSKSDEDNTLGGSLVNLEHKVADDVSPHNSLVDEKAPSRTDSKQPPTPFPKDRSVEVSNEKLELISGQSSEAAVLEENISDTDKHAPQLAAIQPITTATTSVDETHESLNSSSVNVTVQKSNLKNIRPICSKFHRPNLKKLARPHTASSSSPLPDELVLSSDASPNPSINETKRKQKEEQELPRPKTSDVQPDSSDKANPFIQESSLFVGSETSEEYSASSSRNSVTSDAASEKLTSKDNVSSVSPLLAPSDVTAEPISHSSQTNNSTQPPESISGAVNSESTANAIDQVAFKKPPKIFKRVPILKPDWVKPKVDSSKTRTGETENESIKIGGVASSSTENTDGENVTDGSTPIIDMTIDRNSSSCSPLSAVNVNRKDSSTDSEMKDVSDSRTSVKPTVLPKTAPPLKNIKSTKGETDDVRVLFAISAVDYLKRHDHALGDSILRRLIIGDKNMESRSRKSTMCSTCNPQTLKKCLSSLWTFDKMELQTIIKKAVERQKTPVTYASLPGKTLFKPSLGRQRAPTLTASTYGKMSFEVKERLAKQYGANPPQLNKLRMLDLIFYNPSNNPKPSKQPEETQKNEHNLNMRKNEDCEAESTKVSDSDSDPDEPEQQKDVKESSESESRLATCQPTIPVPQVRIGDEGQIILAPESLVMKKKVSEVMTSPVVEEYSFSDSNRKKPSLDRTTWSFEETLQFYKALHSLGTDFSMMNEMFPRRTRANLKSKFKREEKKNSALIDKVLAAQGQTLNFNDVEKDLTTDKTLRRLGLDCARTPACRKNSTKKVWQQKAASIGLNEDSPENQITSPSLSNSSKDLKSTSDSEKNEDQSINAKNSDEELEVTSCTRSPLEKDEDAVFKKPSNIRPPRKRKPAKSVQTIPDKRKKVESASGKGSKETTEKGEDVVFKKPRIPKKRKIHPCSSKRSISPEPVQHILSISLNDEEEESDDTDDSASLDGHDDECLIIKTDIKGHNYSYSRSVRVHIADPEVPIEWNETIEHDRPQTPMSETDSMSETDMDVGSDSEAGEDVEVVSIDVSEIESYLEKTGAVVIESSQENDADAGHLPVTDDAIAEDPIPVTENANAEIQLPISPH